MFMMHESHLMVGQSNRRAATQGAANRISALPNCVLSHILSLLPTKYTVVMSVLALRWKHAKTALQNPSFDDTLYSQPPVVPNVAISYFLRFVNTVL